MKVAVLDIHNIRLPLCLRRLPLQAWFLRFHNTMCSQAIQCYLLVMNRDGAGIRRCLFRTNLRCYQRIHIQTRPNFTVCTYYYFPFLALTNIAGTKPIYQEPLQQPFLQQPLLQQPLYQPPPPNDQNTTASLLEGGLWITSEDFSWPPVSS